MFYVYEWYNKENGYIFYVGKGCGKRYVQTRKRNLLFRKYLNDNECSSRIIKYFTNEDEAFKFEKSRISKLKAKNQCSCNLAEGGYGGYNFTWTEEMRDYKSLYNPMKNITQKKRMSLYNPMKNKDIALKVGKTKMKAVIIKGKYFESIKSAGLFFKVDPNQVTLWCKRGYDREKELCRYANGEYKNISIKTTNSKKVRVNDRVFSSVKKAALFIGVWSETLIRCIKNNRKCKGYIVKYDNQQPSIDLNGL